MRRTWLKVLNSGEPYWKNEIMVDNFAGGGGASAGIEKATGRSVEVASNHDPGAVAMHDANHKNTRHYCEDIWAIDPRTVMPGKPVGLAWFSPDCTHHSKARGGKPREKKIRGLAWVALRWAATRRPRVIMLENVEEFKDWGPLDGEGKPIKSQMGRTFRVFVNALRRQGYEVEWRELRACDYGAPTIRKRFFLIARCDGQPIAWPEPSHGAPDSREVLNGERKPWRTAAEVIDWSIPCPSIFERKKPLAENTLRRIARGIERFVINNPKPFVIKVNHKYDQFRGQEIDKPFQTVTAVNGWTMVSPTLIEIGYGEGPGQSPRAPGLQKPLGTVVAGGRKHALVTAFMAKHYGGNYKGPGSSLDDPLSTVTTIDHNALVTAHIARHFGESVGSVMPEPIGTVTAGGGGKSALVTSHLVKFRGTCKDGQPVTEPMPTITAGGLHVGEVRSFLLKYYGSSTNGQALDDPLHTVTTKERFGLVRVEGVEYQIVDIGMRMLEPHELFAAQGFPKDYIISGYNVNGKPVTKADQVARCGNSVPPVFSEALVRANMPEHCTGSKNRMTFERYSEQVGQLQLSM
ncbi:DNA cytosine methyltransferase [Paenibacillus sp. GbtcB18]|uniref:DNA cytosine methyltransferase n=1 Tax=Paenibacillus sp. GbtcB18 TaxID=2824763 RepID=UPI001C2F9BEF|nr:DNA cytosine methyltransferase [Paenibacillus sp. GbtcB18]